jgi:hypothetical protein
MMFELMHRWGGHRGRRTEWEISSSDSWLHEVAPGLPVMAGAWTSFQDSKDQSSKPYDGHAVWIVLDEGNSEELAFEIGRAIIRMDRNALTAAIRKVKTFEEAALEMEIADGLLNGEVTW